jgi:adenosine kinase
MPIYDEIFKMDGRQIFPGGSALNSARAANYAYKQTDGKEQVAYMGCIGADERGQALQDALKSVGVEGRFHIDQETETGACAVVVKGKERALCANLAAACKFPTEHLTSNMVSTSNPIDKPRLTL